MRRSLDMRSWEAAQRLVREWESEGTIVGAIEVENAVTAFSRDCEARNLAEGSKKLYRILLKDTLLPWCQKRHIRLVSQFDIEAVRDFRESWRLAPITANDRLKKLRAFFRFCRDSGWMKEDPTIGVKLALSTTPPTMPFSVEEMTRILAACDAYEDTHGRPGMVNSRRVKAFVLLLRYSGLRIGDAVALPASTVRDDRLSLRTEKTGTVVALPLPDLVVNALKAFPHGDHFFWSGNGDLASAKRGWDRRLKKVFRAAGLPDGHAHRLRDTFAVALLENGVGIDSVAMLLGNTVGVAEKHYAPWVMSRQIALEDAVRRSWT